MTGLDWLESFKIGQDWSGLGRLRQGRFGLGWVRSGLVRTCQDKTGQVRLGELRKGLERTEQASTKLFNFLQNWSTDVYLHNFFAFFISGCNWVKKEMAKNRSKNTSYNHNIELLLDTGIFSYLLEENISYLATAAVFTFTEMRALAVLLLADADIVRAAAGRTLAVLLFEFVNYFIVHLSRYTVFAEGCRVVI